MASHARLNLERTRTEIRHFYAIHQLVKDIPGVRKKLDVLNKGMIVLVSAAWEGFCEDLAAEALLLIVDEATAATALPVPLQRIIARELQQSPHELAIWRLAGDGWRDVLRDRLEDLHEERNRRLNTPKTGNIDELFRSALGIEQVSTDWSTPRSSAEENASRLDAFIELRNSIAHRGVDDRPVPKTTVRQFNNHVNVLAERTEHVIELCVEGAIRRWPWRLGRSG